MDKPLVSVLMTSYNREKYIAFAIESVIASTYQNWELIIVDDTSKDKTVEIAQAYADNDPRIKVYINQKNLGDYPNRNQAAKYANGKYLKYVDADDYIYPWGLELLINMMENNPEAGWGLCSLLQNNQSPFPIHLSPSEAYRYHYFNKGLFHKAPLSSIIKKDAFHQIGGFRPLRMAGDYDMWHRLAQNFSVVLMPLGIVWYRIHGEQEMKDFDKYAATYDKLSADYLLSKDCPLNLNEKSRLLRKMKLRILSKTAKSFLKFNIAQTIKYFNILKEIVLHQPSTKLIS